MGAAWQKSRSASWSKLELARVFAEEATRKFKSVICSACASSVCYQRRLKSLVHASIGQRRKIEESLVSESGSAEKKFVYQLGFWSSSVATLLVIVAGVTATASIQPFATVVGFLLTSTFLVVMACVHCYAPDDRKVFSLVGLSFAIIYATLISINYFIQLTFVRQSSFDVEIFAMDNPQSMMWVIEVLGYFFMGLSTLFAAAIFGSSKTENLIKWFFVTNGILGILTPIGYALNLPIQILLGGLIIWDIVMPISTALLAHLFKKKMDYT